MCARMKNDDVRNCKSCGEPFVPNTHNQLYCSYGCRWENRAKNARESKSQRDKLSERQPQRTKR
jgi:hypothetical protein